MISRGFRGDKAAPNKAKRREGWIDRAAVVKAEGSVVFVAVVVSETQRRVGIELNQSRQPEIPRMLIVDVLIGEDILAIARSIDGLE